MKQKTDLSAFKRILGYVWPQWPSVLSLLFWSLLMATMLSASLVTVIPVLKVMMGEEGLHGWIDRNVCHWRYGMDFSVPDRTDLYDSSQSFLRQLLVIKVKGDSWAQKAGLQQQNYITYVSTSGPDTKDAMFTAKMLEMLATIEPDKPLWLSLTGINENGQLSARSIQVKAPAKPWYVDWAQWPVSFVPRNETKESKIRAIFVIVSLIGLLTVFRCAARFWQAYLAEKIVLTANTKMREDIFKHAMYMQVGFFSTRGTSDTTSRILGDVAMSGKGIKLLFGKTIREFLSACGGLTLAFAINWKLTLIFMTSAPAVIGLFAMLGKKIKKATKKSLIATSQMLGRIQGAMNALRVVKVYNRQEHEIEQYSKTNNELLRQSLKIAKVEMATNPLLDVMGMIAMSAAIMVGAAWVSDRYAGIEASEFFTLIILLGLSAESIRKVSDVWNYIQQANAAGERVFSVIDEPLEKEEPNARVLKPLGKDIVFKDIAFTYPGSHRPTLCGVSMTIPAGQTVAVVGPNGSGKTTLINLIPRFYDPDSGSILIDGNDIHKATLSSLRDQIGMVTQNIVTFNDTIANNIAYGNLRATREEIIAAAKRAYADEFIAPLPGGYDTVIGENSSGFSGGQLQRIVIARAILKNPRILIFDEAMSQIDADSEAKIHAALADIMKGRTCFLIAHRFSTVISADRIVVMDGGRIIADGSHQQLIEQCATYRNLYETQLIAPQ